MISARTTVSLLVPCLVLMVSSPAMAVITVTGNEIWDGIQNPHSADGVTLLDGVYTISDELFISSNASIFLQDFNTGNISDSIMFDFAGSGGLTFADDTGFIGTYIGSRNQSPARTFTLNMNDNNIAGLGNIYNDIFVLDGLTGDPMNVVINSLADVSLGTVDLRRNDAFAGGFDITAAGAVSIDNLFVGDVSTGGGSAPTVNIIANSIALGDVDTRSLRGDGNGNNGSLNLTALAPPDFNATNLDGNLAAQNVITLSGTVNTNGPKPDTGNINLSAVKVVLESTFAIDLATNATFNIQAGFAGGGFSEADLFMNLSGVTPDSASFIISHDGVGPPVLEWNANVSGNWNNGGNWDFNVPPNSNTQTARFGGNITSPQTIFTNDPVTVKGLQFDTSSTVALAGPGSINLDADTGDASVEVLQGSHQIQVAVNLADNTTVSASSGAEIDFNNVIDTAGNTLSISGDGQVNINNIVTGGGTVNNSGTLGGGGSNVINGDLNSTGTLDIDIGGTDAVAFDAFIVTGTANINGSVIDVSLLDGFSLTGTESFTILTASTLSATGITLGGSAASMFSLVTGTNTIMLLAGAVLEADFNMDGIVNGNDFLIWQAGFGQFPGGGATKDDGDANLDGFVDGNDFLIWQQEFAPGNGSGSAAVPEPSTGLLSLLILAAALGVMSPRGRRSR